VHQLDLRLERRNLEGLHDVVKVLDAGGREARGFRGVEVDVGGAKGTKRAKGET
jgi:hypothetical protein